MRSQLKDRRFRRARKNRQKGKTWHPQPDLEAFRQFRHILCRQSTWRWMAILLMAIWIPRAPAAEIPAADVRPDQMQSGTLLFRMKHGYEIATRMNTAIDARITGLVARAGRPSIAADTG